MDSLANSVVANVEASMTFTLASKLVDAMLALEQQAWILGAMCLIVILFLKGSSNEFAQMGSQILVLSFGRLLLLQVGNPSSSFCIFLIWTKLTNFAKQNRYT